MTAPALPLTIALGTLRDEVTYTDSRLMVADDARVSALAKGFKPLLTKWDDVSKQQNALWDAQVRADARVAAADDNLDDFILDLARVLRALPQGEKGAEWKTYFKISPSKLATPVLGEQLSTMRDWVKKLAKEKEPTVAALKKRLAALIEAADAAVTARKDANDANETFRTRGELMAFIKAVIAERDSTAAAIDAIVAGNDALPRGYSSRFFRARTTKPSAEEKRAKAEKREADAKARAEAKVKVAEAQARMKAALAELRAAQKATKTRK